MDIDMNQIPDRYDKIGEFGLTKPQFDVLRLLVEQSQTRAELAVIAYEESRWDSSAPPHCEDFLAAVAECCDKGLMFTVTFDDEKAYRRILESESIPVCDDSAPRAMSLDLTPKGYELITRARVSLGWEHPRGVRHVDRLDGFAVESYGVSEKACLDLAALQLDCYNDRDEETDDDGVVYIRHRIKTLGPVAVGRWRLNRHEVVERGFVARTIYRYIGTDYS